MLISLTTLFATLSSIFRSRAALELENLALRHQVGVLQRSAPETDPRGPPIVRLPSRIWRDWRWALAIVKPETTNLMTLCRVCHQRKHAVTGTRQT